MREGCTIMVYVFSLYLVFVFILSSRAQNDLSGCPDNLKTLQYVRAYTDTCIQFVRNELSWDDSRKLCRNTGGDLVMLKDATKQNFFLRVLNEMKWDKNQIWIGLTDKHHEGHWEWVDGTKIAYGHFASGQGNNYNGGFLFTSGSSDDCALLRRDDGGQWHDYPCHPPIANIGYHYSYACEFPRNLSVLKPTTQTISTRTKPPGPTPVITNVKTPTTTKTVTNQTHKNIVTSASTRASRKTLVSTLQNVGTTVRVMPDTTIRESTVKPCQDNKLVNCTDPAFCGLVFRKNCPVTCGLCDLGISSTIHTSRFPVQPTTRSPEKPCEDNKFLNCNDPDICASPFKKNCPVTCGVCVPCIDNRFVNCQSSGICSSDFKQHCPNTCGLCGLRP